MSLPPLPRLKNLATDSKFIAPSFDPTLFLPRDLLLNKITKQNFKHKKFIFIQAQPGQGKTIFTAQLLNCRQLPFVWYRVTKEDTDPVFFLLALLTGIQKKFSDFHSPVIEQMTSSGEIFSENLNYLAQTLANDITENIKNPFYIVVDDLHLLENNSIALQALSELIDNTTHEVRFILASRHTISLPLRNINIASSGITIENDSLKFSRTEISQLFNEHLRIPISKNDINFLADISQGWLAALLLLGEQMRYQMLNNSQNLTKTSKLTNLEEIYNFFELEVFSTFDNNLITSLLKLAPLDEIPLELAVLITSDKNIEKSLQDLAEKNLFVRQLDKRKKSFLFHALLQEALLKRAQTSLSSKTRQEIFCKVGEYYVSQSEYVQAINYFLKAEAFSTAGEILKQVGMSLFATNQTITLAAILEQIPQDVIRNSAWLCLYAGILGLNKDPSSSYVYYETARKIFSTQGEEWGEMLVLVQIIHFHLYIDGRHNLGRPHLFRLEKLFQAHKDRLEPIPLMRFANAIAGGYCFFEFNADKVNDYTKISFDSAEHLDLPNYLAAARVVSCYQCSFIGDWDTFHTEIEMSLPLIGNPRVCLEYKLGLIMAQISVLIMKGDFSNYLRKKEWLIDSVGKNITSLSVVAPFLTIYDASFLIATRKYKEAKTTITTGLQTKGAGEIPHQRSQMLHFLALLEAVDGNRDATITAAEESRQLRLGVGPGRFDALNQLILGIAYTLIGDFTEAEKLFNSAFETIIALREEHLTVSLHFNRAYLFMKMNREQEAKDELCKGLIKMKQHQYVYFFGWLPEIMEVVLESAVNWDIEPIYAADLAKKRLGLSLEKSNPPLPILRIEITGKFAFYLDEIQIAIETNFSPIQRQCLALLLVSPGHCFSQEQLQTVLWPESSEIKTRSNFDTMLSRLRKELAPLLAPNPVKSYLSLQKGLLQLKHVESDIQQFQEFSKRGLKCIRKNEFWLAENYLYFAMECWGGKPLKNIPANESVDAARFNLENLYIKSVNLWAKILAKNNRIKDAINVLDQALLLNPIEHELVQNLYCLNIKLGNSGQAAKVIQNYRDNLLCEEYLPVEIDEILEPFWE